MTVSRSVLTGLIVVAAITAGRPAAGQTATPVALMTASTSSGNARIVWTLVGGGIGFGAGVLTGLALFDDAIHSERKAWTTAVVGAAAGGVAGTLLSRGAGASSRARTTDSLWNGMLVGAAAGAVVGLWYVPVEHCNTQTNPECPGILRLTVGVPAIAGGAALGALVDRAIGGTANPAPEPSAGVSSTARTVFAPWVAPGAVGFVYVRSFE